MDHVSKAKFSPLIIDNCVSGAPFRLLRLLFAYTPPPNSTSTSIILCMLASQVVFSRRPALRVLGDTTRPHASRNFLIRQDHAFMVHFQLNDYVILPFPCPFLVPLSNFFFLPSNYTLSFLPFFRKNSLLFLSCDFHPFLSSPSPHGGTSSTLVALSLYAFPVFFL